MIDHATYVHIIERRIVDGDRQVALVMSRMQSVIVGPSHRLYVSKDSRKIDLYGCTPGDPSGVVVCLKCMPDGLWVCTSYPLGGRSLRRLSLSGRVDDLVRPVALGEPPEGPPGNTVTLGGV